jgi:GNAT superfamily N-acetyltransferase
MQALQADTPIELVTFLPTHLEGALALSRQAVWPHRLEDWRLMLELSQGVVAIEDGQRVVGTILATPFAQDCATINMVIVDESMRGRGLGRQLMDAAFALTGNRPLRLVATQDGLPLYEKLGFVQSGTVMQHQGVPTALPAKPAHVAFEAAPDIAELTALDRAAYGADRSGLLAYLKTVARFAVIRHEGRVAAFAALREFGRGEVIGPVVAETEQQAKDLIAFCVASRPGAFLRVDTTEEAGLSPWLTEIGLAHVGGGIAMLRGAQSRSAAAVRTFALANQALG